MSIFFFLFLDGMILVYCRVIFSVILFICLGGESIVRVKNFVRIYCNDFLLGFEIGLFDL